MTETENQPTLVVSRKPHNFYRLKVYDGSVYNTLPFPLPCGTDCFTFPLFTGESKPVEIAEAGTTERLEEAKTEALAWEEKCDFQTAALRDLDIAYRALKNTNENLCRNNTRLLNENMEGAACNRKIKARVEELEHDSSLDLFIRLTLQAKVRKLEKVLRGIKSIEMLWLPSETEEIHADNEGEAEALCLMRDDINAALAKGAKDEPAN